MSLLVRSSARFGNVTMVAKVIAIVCLTLISIEFKLSNASESTTTSTTTTIPPSTTTDPSTTASPSTSSQPAVGANDTSSIEGNSSLTRYLDSLFDDPSMKTSLISFFNTVPTTHEIRKTIQLMLQANISLVIGKEAGKKPTVQSPIMEIVSLLFHFIDDVGCSSDPCNKSCPSDTSKIACIPCPKHDNCESLFCPPCLVPSQCLRTREIGDCPARPDCPPCDDSVAKESPSTSSTSKPPTDIQTTEKPSSTPTLRSNTTIIHHPTQSWPLPKLEDFSYEIFAHFFVRKPVNSSQGLPWPQIGDIVIPPIIASAMTPTMTSTTSPSTTTESPTTTTTASTSTSTTTNSGSKRSSLRNSKHSRKKSQRWSPLEDHHPLEEPTRARGRRSSNSGTKSSNHDGDGSPFNTKAINDYKRAKNSSGIDLFYHFLDKIPDKKGASKLHELIELVPANPGGAQEKFANRILANFGESHQNFPPMKGSNREMTYFSPGDNLKSILGQLFDRYHRKKCNCTLCETFKLCDNCTLIENCSQEKAGSCKPCPENPTCPAPESCEKYPPCHKCTRLAKNDDPDDDGDTSKLDDLDLVNTVKPGELDKEISCNKGFTCPFQKSCGRADLNPLSPKGSQTGYITHGEDEVYGEWPSFVRIAAIVDKQTSTCGGVLISDKHVLTASHCVKKPHPDGEYRNTPVESFEIFIGDHRPDKEDEFEKQYKVSSICYASNFVDTDDTGSRYDFAVMTLDREVEFNEHIQPACLPYKPLTLKRSTKCFVIGAGLRFWDGLNPELPDVIQKMPLVRESCKDWGIRHDDRSRHCFSRPNAKGDSCGGDSGGPVLCLNKYNRWTVMGLVSYGSKLCDGSESTGWVAVYSRVQALLKQMKKECKI